MKIKHDTKYSEKEGAFNAHSASGRAIESEETHNFTFSLMGLPVCHSNLTLFSLVPNMLL